MGGHHPSDFKVEFWNARGNIERVMATCDNVIVARAAYEATVAQYPQAHVTLRQGTRVIAEHGGRRLV